MHNVIVESFLVKEDVVFLSRVRCGVPGNVRKGGAKGMYLVVLLEKLGGFCCAFFSLRFVLHNSYGVEGQVDLSWCSHVVVFFV